MPEVEQLLQKNGVTIKIGDYLELGDLVGNKYTLTWQYDKELEEPYEMHKHDTFDFKYVELMPNELSRFKEIELHYQNLPVHKLLSGLSDQVKSILLEPGQATTVRTCFFEIAIEQALEAGEVKIIQGYQENGAAEKSLLENLRFMHEGFLRLDCIPTKN
jgi:hypothetical protein